MSDKNATPRGAKPSRMDAMNSISHGRVNSMAEDLGLKPEDIISDDPIEEPPITGEEEDELKAKEGEKPKDGEDEVSDDELKAKEKEEPAPTPKEKEIDDIMDYIDIDQGEEKKYRFKVKIDGEEQILTADQMKRGYQKDATASKRLEAASIRTKELDQREEELKRKEEDLEKRAKQPVTAVVSDDDKGDTHLPQEDDVKKFLDAFYGGKEDEAAAALTELLASGRMAPTTKVEGADDATQPKAVDEATVAKMVRDELLWDDARAKFKEDFEDVWKDPFLADMADTFLTEELDVIDDYKEAFNNAGNRVREWMKDHGLKQPTPKEDGEAARNARDAKKQDLDTVEDAGVTSDSGKVEEQPQTVKDTIAEMAASRGAHRQFRT